MEIAFYEVTAYDAERVHITTVRYLTLVDAQRLAEDWKDQGLCTIVSRVVAERIASYNLSPATQQAIDANWSDR